MAKNNLSRRELLKVSSMFGALAGSGALGLQYLSSNEVRAASVTPGTWVPTCCNMCGGTTGIMARVDNGRVTKIEPNPNNPIGVCNISSDYTNLKSTGARMCPKGNAGMMTLYDPDRLQVPLKRKGARGAGGWEQISYQQAVSEIAARLAEIKPTFLTLSDWISSDFPRKGFFLCFNV